MKITTDDTRLDQLAQHPEFGPFVCFDFDASQMRHIDGPQKGELMFPELGGKETPLFQVVFTPQADLDREAEATQKSAHQQRVADYANRVAAGLGLFETPCEGDDEDDEDTPTVEVDETPEDEWDHFWGGEGMSPTQRGFVSRARIHA